MRRSSIPAPRFIFALFALLAFPPVISSAAPNDPSSFANTDPSTLAKAAAADLAAGHYDDCISKSSAAAARFHSAGDLTGEANVLTIRGQALFYSGNLASALRDFEQGVAVARQSNDANLEITRLNNIGAVYNAQGLYGQALRAYSAADAALGRYTAAPWYNSRRRLTDANLAVLYQRVGNYNLALDLYRRINSGAQDMPDRERAQALSNLGTLYRRLGDPVSALENYRAAQALFHKSALLSGEIGVLNNIGIAQTLDGHSPAEAVRTFSRALLMASASGGRSLIMSSLLYRGEARLRAGDPAGAMADFKESRQLAEELKATEELWRSDYGLARVADRQKNNEASDQHLRAAIGTIERMRQTAATSGGLSGFLIERREVYDLLIEHECSRPHPAAESIFRLMEDSRARELQDKRHTPRATLEQLRARLAPGTVLLEYWLGARTMATAVVAAHRARLTCEPLPPAAMNAINRLPGILADPAQTNWRESAEPVAALLLRNISETTAGSLHDLIVVPDSELSRIPFEALPLDNTGGALLLDRAAVTYLPYGGAYSVADPAETWVGQRWAPPWRHTLTAFADTRELPQAAREVHSIAEEVGGRAELHLGQSVQRHQIAGPSPILHFATHAFADPEDPNHSWILLKPGEYLYLREAAALPLTQTSLVTVSSCESGTGKLVRGEGVQSFTSAFFAAGAKATVTSLWRVGDAPTAELMERFYARLAGGLSASDALREARLDFRRSGKRAAHPAYWAAFILSGDGTVRIPRPLSWWWIIAIAACGGLPVFFIRRKAGTETLSRRPRQP